LSNKVFNWTYDIADTFGWDRDCEIELPPRIIKTNRNPPMLERKQGTEKSTKNHDEADRVWDIDGLLGLYEPDEVQIVLFDKYIGQCAKILHIDYSVLTDIVLIHEFAHWACHVGPFPSILPRWNTASFMSHGEGIHELLAQLFTKKYCDRKGKQWIDSMEVLTARQSPVYQSYRDAVNKHNNQPDAFERAGKVIAERRELGQCDIYWDKKTKHFENADDALTLLAKASLSPETIKVFDGIFEKL